MFKRWSGWTLVGLCWVTLVACGRSTRNGAAPGDSSMAGAGSDGADLSTSSGGSAGAEPSAGGSETSAGGGRSGGTGARDTGASAGNGGAGTDATGGASTSDGGTGALSTDGDTGTGANAATGGDASGGSSTGGGGSNGSAFCEWGTYDTDLTDDELTCEPWTVCEPGSFEKEFGGATRDRVCEPCPEGTWSDQVWETSCAPATLCDFGEQEDIELTPTHDRTCVVADVFGKQPFTDEVDAGALVVTDQGAYLSVRETFEGKALVLRYSLDGEYLGSWSPDAEQSIIGDLTSIGDELVVAAVKIVPDPEVGYTEPGFIKKFAADGELVWQVEFDDDPSDHFMAIGAASHDDTVYAVAHVMEVECTRSGDTTTCTTGASSLVLRVLDADGNEVLSETLEDDSTVSDVLGVAVGSTGKVHVAVTRQTRRFADDCDQISEEDDPTYYYYNCVVGVATWSDSLVLFDGTELVAEYSLGDRGRFSRLVAAGASGSAYALARVDPANHLLVRMDAGGELLLDDVLDLEGEWLETFAVTDTGLILVGFSNHGPVLLRADPNGQILAREVLEEVATPWEISGLREAADGRVFLGGTASSAAFVVPWPE